MRNLHNIEKLPGKSHYTGYSNLGIYHIRKTNSSYGNWCAWPVNGGANIYAMRLQDMADKLARL